MVAGQPISRAVSQLNSARSNLLIEALYLKAVAGGVVGGVAIIVCLAFSLFYFQRKAARQVALPDGGSSYGNSEKSGPSNSRNPYPPSTYASGSPPPGGLRMGPLWVSQEEPHSRTTGTHNLFKRFHTMSMETLCMTTVWRKPKSTTWASKRSPRRELGQQQRQVLFQNL